MAWHAGEISQISKKLFLLYGFNLNKCPPLKDGGSGASTWTQFGSLTKGTELGSDIAWRMYLGAKSALGILNGIAMMLG